ncbi:MAG: DNA-3-methyladenine glycosylase family protein [Ktedonobacterales bacterium]
MSIAEQPVAPVAVTTRSIELAPAAPYDFDRALVYLRSSPSAVLEAISPDGVYRRAFTLDGRDTLLTLRSLGSSTEPRLLLEVTGTAVDERTVEAAARQIRRVFLLDADPEPFLRVAAADPVFDRVARQFPGLRPVLIASPFEALTWAIIGQQITVGFARTLKQTLLNLRGHSLNLEGQAYPVFPTPEDVAALDPAELTTRQFSRSKASYVIHAARAVAEGALDLAAVGALPFDEAVAEMTRLRGIGRWTAEYVLMRGLGVPDSFPAADTGLRAAIGRAYGLGRSATEAEARAYAERWAGWRSWAAFIWWMALQTKTPLT